MASFKETKYDFVEMLFLLYVYRQAYKQTILWLDQSKKFQNSQILWEP